MPLVVHVYALSAPRLFTRFRLDSCSRDFQFLFYSASRLPYLSVVLLCIPGIRYYALPPMHSCIRPSRLNLDNSFACPRYSFNYSFAVVNAPSYYRLYLIHLQSGHFVLSLPPSHSPSLSRPAACRLGASVTGGGGGRGGELFLAARGRAWWGGNVGALGNGAPGTGKNGKKEAEYESRAVREGMHEGGRAK